MEVKSTLLFSYVCVHVHTSYACSHGVYTCTCAYDMHSQVLPHINSSAYSFLSLLPRRLVPCIFPHLLLLYYTALLKQPAHIFLAFLPPGDGPVRPGECEVKQSTERLLPCYYYLFSRHPYLIFCCWDKTHTNFGRNKFVLAYSLHPPGPADRK